MTDEPLVLPPSFPSFITQATELIVTELELTVPRKKKLTFEEQNEQYRAEIEQTVLNTSRHKEFLAEAQIEYYKKNPAKAVYNIQSSKTPQNVSYDY